MSATTANNAEFQDGGKPVAQPFYLVDVNGNPLGGSINLNQIGGSPPSAGNPLFTEDFLRAYAINGQSFLVSNGLSSAASGTANTPLCIFNPNSAKNILIYSVVVCNGNSSIAGFLSAVTSNPSYGTSLTPTNAKAGGGASVASVTWTGTSQSAPSNSAIFAEALAGGNVPLNLLPNGQVYFLPANANNGLVAWVQSYNGGYCLFSVEWIEF